MDRTTFITKFVACKEKGLSFLDCIKELKNEIPEEEINKHLSDMFLNSNLDYNTFTEEGITSTSLGAKPEQQAISDKSKDYLNDGNDAQNSVTANVVNEYKASK